MFIFLLQIFSSFSFFLVRSRVWPGLFYSWCDGQKMYLRWILHSTLNVTAVYTVHCPLYKTNSDDYEIKRWRWYLFNRHRYVAGSGNETKSVCRSRGYFGRGKEKKIMASHSALNFRILGLSFDEIVWVKQMTNEIEANWAWRAIN